MSLGVREVQRFAERMLADYDAHRPNEIFAENGTDWLTLEDAYVLQRAVAELRAARGERCLGYKLGCVSRTIQEQLGLDRPVHGYLWKSEILPSGFHLSGDSSDEGRKRRFVNFAVEGEIALRLSRDISTESDCDVADCIECWFPVIELHNAIFRGPKPTSQELVAGNAMHAGFVAPALPEQSSLSKLAQAEIQVEIDGEVVEKKKVTDLPGGPLGSVRRLAALLTSASASLKAGDIVLTGSPGRLIPIRTCCSIVVACERQHVQLFVQNEPSG